MLDTTRVSFIREGAWGAERGPAQSNRAHHMAHSAPAPVCLSAPTVEIDFLPGGQVVHERPCNGGKEELEEPGPWPCPVPFSDTATAEQLRKAPPAASPASAAMLETTLQTRTPGFQGAKEHDRHVFPMVRYTDRPKAPPCLTKYSGPRGRRRLANLMWPSNPVQTLFWPHPHLHGSP